MIELWKWEIKPGEIFESGGHPTGTFELFHVEQGTLTLEISETTLIIEQGCSAIAKTDAPHRYINNGNKTVIFAMTVAELHQ